MRTKSFIQLCCGPAETRRNRRRGKALANTSLYFFLPANINSVGKTNVQVKCIAYLRRGGPKSTASSAFRFSFCLCRWSNIFSCIDINDGSFAAILKYGEKEHQLAKQLEFNYFSFQCALYLSLSGESSICLCF